MALVFSAVAMDKGERPIGDLSVGDQVLAYNEAADTTGYYPITAVMVHDDPIIVHLTIDGEEIETTPEHPFYTQEKKWVNAGELTLGMHVRKADGSYGVVEALQMEHHLQKMYNLTVADAHTFFVGSSQWLVHNNDCGININDYKPGPETGFSGAYDPESGQILMRPSGETLLADGSVPPGRVMQAGGMLR